LKKFSSV